MRKFIMFCRNMIQINCFVSFLYDVIAALPIYRFFVDIAMKNRLNELEQKRNYRLMIEICGICNAKCVFCPYETMKRKKMLMPDEIFDKILFRLKDEQINPPKIELYMIGEPFIDKKIFEKIDRIKKEFPNTSIEITSNFGMVNEEIIEKLLDAPVDFINISLNAATEDTYNKLMGLDYQKTVYNINRLLELKKIKKSKLFVQLSIVLCEENKNQKMKFWKQWAHKVDSLRYQKATEWAGAMPLKIKYFPKIKHYYPCYEMFVRLPILSNGDYALCCQDPEGLLKHNIMDTKILDVYNTKQYKRFKEIHLGNNLKEFAMCNQCTGVNSNGASWLTHQ